VLDSLTATAKRWTLVAAVLGSSIVFLDSTVVNVALPRIGKDLPRLSVSILEGQSYVYNAYLLTLSALLILAGALNDQLGRKRMFLVGLAGFGVASVLCGLAPNMEFLIGARIFQGAFGALLIPGSLALVTVTFSGEERGHAFGVWAGASAGTAILGPFVGGFLVDAVSWRLAFVINVPLIAFAMWCAVRYVRESKEEAAPGGLDWTGALLVALAVGGLTFGAIAGAQHNWVGATPWIALGLGAIATLVLPFYMARASNPLIPPSLWRFRNFTVTNLSTMLIYGALYVTGYFTGLFLQGTLGYTATAAGLASIPGFVLLALFSARVGKVAGKTGPRMFMAVGPLVMALGLFLLALIPASSHPWLLSLKDVSTFVPPGDYLLQVLPGMLLFGLGLTIMVAPLTTALMTSVPEKNSALASAINNAISRVGPQLAGAAIFIAIAASFYSGFAQQVGGVDPSSVSLRAHVSALTIPAQSDLLQAGITGDVASLQYAASVASTNAFHLSMYVGLILLVAGGVVNLVGIRNQVDVARAP
jgi:EmrB/QacA subfamily drug resistance transporter